MKYWLESMSVKNLVIIVLLGLLIFSFVISLSMLSGISSKLDHQEFRMIPAEIAGTINIPLESRRERLFTMMSGYLTSHAENYNTRTVDSFYIPMLMNAAPESYTELKDYFANIAAFASARHLVSMTQIDPSSEHFDMKTGTYKAMGVTVIRSSTTNNVLATELREYTLKWRIDSGYAGVVDYSYVILDSTLPERKETGEKQQIERSQKKQQETQGTDNNNA